MQKCYNFNDETGKIGIAIKDSNKGIFSTYYWWFINSLAYIVQRRWLVTSMTITTYYNDIQLTSTTYCVYDSPTKKEIYLPKIFLMMALKEC